MQNRLQGRAEIEYAYPLVPLDIELANTLPWHLNDNTAQPSGTAGLNVANVWNQGVRGRGVVIGVVDDGFDINHIDLKTQVSGDGEAPRGYRADLSYDFSENDGSPWQILKTYVLYSLGDGKPQGKTIEAGKSNTSLALRRESLGDDRRLDYSNSFGGPLRDVMVHLDISHSQPEELRLTLVSPEGTHYELTDLKAGNHAYDTGDVFYGQKPSNQSPQNYWKLDVDTSNTDEPVSINSWALEFTTANFHGTLVAGVSSAQENPLEGVSGGSARLPMGWFESGSRLVDGLGDRAIAQA
ncbi:MAG: S8 family serine peptidase [Coleofasciculaceae cyanobacterium SM2_3_26]|nr:S8 family serine peptidase [Coleofasciculaceae cyanobacterium SM2_3_26]